MILGLVIRIPTYLWLVFDYHTRETYTLMRFDLTMRRIWWLSVCVMNRVPWLKPWCFWETSCITVYKSYIIWLYLVYFTEISSPSITWILLLLSTIIDLKSLFRYGISRLHYLTFQLYLRRLWFIISITVIHHFKIYKSSHLIIMHPSLWIIIWHHISTLLMWNSIY